MLKTKPEYAILSQKDVTALEIRVLQPEDDRAAVSRVYEESWKYAYRGILPDAYLDSLPTGQWADRIDTPGRRNLILVDGERVAGTSSISPSRFPEWADWGEIISIYLLPEYLDKGYGGPLLTAAVNGLREWGYSRIFLWVLEENARARRFYEKHGFRSGGVYLENAIGGKPLREVQYVYSAEEVWQDC